MLFLQLLKKKIRNWRRFKLALRWLRPHTYARFNWTRVLSRSQPQWRVLVQREKNSGKVLVATSTGSHWACASLESLLAAALAVRGAEPQILLCDGVLPACQECDVRTNSAVSFATHGPGPELCNTCYEPAHAMLAPLGFVIHRYSDFLEESDRLEAQRIAVNISLHDVADFRYNNIGVGEHALAGALRFFARGDLEKDPYAEAVLRRYLQAAILTALVCQRILERERYDAVVAHHGLYVPQGIIGEVARANGVRVINWNPAYRSKTFIFSHENTYHRTMISEPVSTWENLEWNAALELKLMNYLRSRWTGAQDWIRFQGQAEEDLANIRKRYDLDPRLPCIALLTNVIWDAQLHYPANAFTSMLEWLFYTIEHFRHRADVQLLIRIHPAEISGAIPSDQKVMDEIKVRYPTMPRNIHVIAPEDGVSTYAAVSLCKAAIIYGTKMGVELTCLGMPVIVAGEAWVRNKGFTVDVENIDQYRHVLESLPRIPSMAAAEITRAKKYAYHFFFRRMVPFGLVQPKSLFTPFSLSVKNISDLDPGKDIGLDVVCDGILSGTEFVFPDDLKQ